MSLDNNWQKKIVRKKKNCKTKNSCKWDKNKILIQKMIFKMTKMKKI